VGGHQSLGTWMALVFFTWQKDPSTYFKVDKMRDIVIRKSFSSFTKSTLFINGVVATFFQVSFCNINVIF